VAVLVSAEKLFEMALAVNSGGRTNGDLQASVANYRIAADALRASAELPPETRADLERQMRTFATFLPRLGREGGLTREELGITSELKRFFKQIAEDGAAEDYQRYARGSEGSFGSILD